MTVVNYAWHFLPKTLWTINMSVLYTQNTKLYFVFALSRQLKWVRLANKMLSVCVLLSEQRITNVTMFRNQIFSCQRFSRIEDVSKFCFIEEVQLSRNCNGSAPFCNWNQCHFISHRVALSKLLVLSIDMVLRTKLKFLLK